MPRFRWIVLCVSFCLWTSIGHPQSKTEDHSSDSNAIIPPKILETVSAEYTDSARKAHVQGFCILYVSLDKKGKLRKINVSVPLGSGLDEMAIEAVEHYKFAPATQKGKPVAVEMHVSVPFFIPGEKATPALLTALLAQVDPGGTVHPVLIHHVDPQYPSIAWQSGFQGICVIGMTIDTKGVPEDLKVLQSAGLVLDGAAMEAVRQWRYRPAFVDGKVMAVPTTVTVQFGSH